jgi:hypothetical protein
MLTPPYLTRRQDQEGDTQGHLSAISRDIGTFTCSFPIVNVPLGPVVRKRPTKRGVHITGRGGLDAIPCHHLPTFSRQCREVTATPRILGRMAVKCYVTR